jgi:hydroxyacylglutathione hydrolase
VNPIATGLFQLKGFPPNAINVYLAEDVLIDAGTRFDAKRILRQLRGRQLAAHALTHADPDHQGASARVCGQLGIPLWCGEGDAAAMETGNLLALQPDHWIARASANRFGGPPYPVSRRLQEGDVVAGFKVLETPGHTPGHMAFWREHDRILICGDVLLNMNPATTAPGLHQPPGFFTPDPALNRDSARRLAELEPSVVCFGHGPPLRDTRRFVDFVGALT